jgi:hypothetical protein
MKRLDELLLHLLAPTGRSLGTLRCKLLTRRSLVLPDDPVSKPTHDWILLPVRGSDSEICQPTSHGDNTSALHDRSSFPG